MHARPSAAVVFVLYLLSMTTPLLTLALVARNLVLRFVGARAFTRLRDHGALLATARCGLSPIPGAFPGAHLVLLQSLIMVLATRRTCLFTN